MYTTTYIKNNADSSGMIVGIELLLLCEEIWGNLVPRTMDWLSKGFSILGVLGMELLQIPTSNCLVFKA